MRVSKLFQVVQTLSPAEASRFVEYMQSAYFNKNATLSAITVSLVKLHPYEVAPDPQTVYEGTGITEPYSYATFYNWLSDIYVHLLNFFSVEGLHNVPAVQKHFQAAQLRLHRAHHPFELFIARALKEVDDNPRKSDELYDLKWKLLQEQSLFLTLTKPNTNREILQQELDALLSSALIRLLRFYTLMLHEGTTHAPALVPHLAPQVMDFLNSNNIFSSIPTVAVYMAVYNLETSASHSDFNALKTTLQQYKSNLQFIDVYMAMLHLGNYCANQINVVGNEEYFKEALALIKIRVEEGNLNLDNLLYPDFVYCVRMAVAAGDIPYAITFINLFRSSLPLDVADDVLNFSNAVICMAQNKWDAALRLLATVNLSNYVFNVQVRSYTIQCLVEQQLWDQALAACDTFRHYLAKEKEMTDYYRLALKDFVRIIPKMVRGFADPAKFTSAKKEKLIVEISTMSSNAFNLRNWLRRKM